MTADVPARAPVVVIGIGAALRGDDGIGPAATDALGPRLAGTSTEVLCLDGEPTRVIEAWRDRRLAVVVDAVRTGAPPGTLHRIEPGVDRLPDSSGPASSHHAGLTEAIALAEVLDRLPDRLIVLGLEPGDLHLGRGLSAPVAAGLDHLVDAVAHEVGSPLTTVVAMNPEADQPHAGGASEAADLAAVRENEQVLGVMLTLHGAVHVIGFVLAWQLLEPSGFEYDDVWPDAGTAGARVVGVGWLAVAIAIMVVGLRMAYGRSPTRRTVVAVALASILVCSTALPAALPGIVINATLIGAMTVLAVLRRRTFDPVNDRRPGATMDP